MFDKIKAAASNAWQGIKEKVLGPVKRHVIDPINRNLVQPVKTLIVGVVVAAASAVGAHAALPTVADITGMVDNGTTVFTAVSVLVIAMVGFFILIRIVKGIRK